jgi:hypothetical protein
MLSTFQFRIFSHLACHVNKTIRIKIHKSIIFVILLYGCETWEKHRLKVYEKNWMMGIFGPKRDEATEGWRKFHSEEFASPDIIRMKKSRG